MKTFKDTLLNLRPLENEAFFDTLKNNYSLFRLNILIPMSLRKNFVCMILRENQLNVGFNTTNASIEFNKYGAKNMLDSIKSILKDSKLQEKLHLKAQDSKKIKKFNDIEELNMRINNEKFFEILKNINSIKAYKVGYEKNQKYHKYEKIDMFEKMYEEKYIELCKNDFEIQCTDKYLIEIFNKIKQAIKRNLKAQDNDKI